jgi:hypothetical protein
MKTSKLIVTLVIVMILVGCSGNSTPTAAPTAVIMPTSIDHPPVPTPTANPPTEMPGLTIEFIKNSIVTAPEMQKSIQLMDGKFSENLADGSTIMVYLNENVAFGDINNDGIDDAAFLIVESMGGTGIFYSITSFISGSQGFTQTNSRFIDDRAVIHSLMIDNSEVILNANVHAINDPMVNPTVTMTKTYHYFNDGLSLWRQTTLMSDGTIRSINIDTPMENEEVSGSVTITGTMPIAPFENNLQIQFIGQNGMANYIGSLMVDAEEMGQPATFNVTMPISSFPSGAMVKIQLMEVSMADGSPMLIDSVLVKVK